MPNLCLTQRCHAERPRFLAPGGTSRAEELFQTAFDNRHNHSGPNTGGQTDRRTEGQAGWRAGGRVGDRAGEIVVSFAYMPH